MDSMTDWHCEILMNRIIEADYRGMKVRGRVFDYGPDWFMIRREESELHPLRMQCEEVLNMRIEGLTL